MRYIAMYQYYTRQNKLALVDVLRLRIFYAQRKTVMRKDVNQTTSSFGTRTGSTPVAGTKTTQYGIAGTNNPFKIFRARIS